jgi:hypothetical protein
MIEFIINTWTSPKRYISSFNKIRKVGDGVTYTCQPFDFDDWDKIEVCQSDEALLTLQITDAINHAVLNVITSSTKVPYPN